MEFFVDENIAEALEDRNFIHKDLFAGKENCNSVTLGISRRYVERMLECLFSHLLGKI